MAVEKGLFQAPKGVEAPVEKPKVKKTRFSSKKKKKD